MDNCALESEKPPRIHIFYYFCRPSKSHRAAIGSTSTVKLQFILDAKLITHSDRLFFT